MEEPNTSKKNKNQDDPVKTEEEVIKYAVNNTDDLSAAPMSAKTYNSGNRYKFKAIVILAVVLVLVTLITYVSSSKNNATETKISELSPAIVNITSSGYSPSTLNVDVNQPVEWFNQSPSPHEVNSDPYPNNSNTPSFNDNNPLQQSNSWFYVFDKAGTYTYHDDLNPYSFKGTIVVKKQD